MTDLEMLVELRDLKQRIAVLIAELSARERREDEMFARILNAVRESDECTASFGGCIPPQPRVEAPSDGHLPTPAHMCLDALDDVD
jgi:cell division septum initiation protein DivIVA